MIVRAKSYPRVGLIGNPSDGFFGKTISYTFSNFVAEVTLFESPELEIQPSRQDKSVFDSIGHLADDITLYGYYGGLRLLKASVKKFHDYCSRNNICLDNRNFTIRYKTDIPFGVGLAGSSAIASACFKALMSFYGIKITKPVLAGLILSAEAEELGIAAGLQDRVVQVYEGMVYMDFDREVMQRQGHGIYRNINVSPADMPNFYVAYRDDLSEESGKVHSNVRERFNLGDKEIIDAMKYWADLTDKFDKAIAARDVNLMGELINANFDKRRQIYQLSASNVQMVEAARSVGASSKFTGSGGAIVGIYKDENMYAALEKALGEFGITVIKPIFKPQSRDV